MQLCQYEEGQNAASASMALQNEGSVNWFKTLEYSTILAFHSAQYDKAFSHYQTATTHPQYKNMEKLDAEIWTLFEAYLYFLHTKKKLKGGEVEKSKLKNFRVHKFINELEILDKDRDGMNIQAKIIEVVIRLTAEDLKMMGEAEALDKYRLRHVVARDEIGYRTNQFLKILVKLANHRDVYSCDQEEIEEIVSDIATTPYSIEKQGYKTEIIPFNILWQVIKERSES